MENSEPQNFIIMRNDGSYIYREKNNKLSHTKDKSRAILGTYDKQLSLVQNCFKPDVRNDYSVISLEENNSISIFTNENKTDPVVLETLNIINSFDRKALKDCEDTLSKDIANIDKEICDIYHYIEFFNFDAATGYKAYKMLHDRLKQRRILKDNLEKLNIIESSSIKDIMDGNLTARLNGFEKRRYSPRVLTELFNDKMRKE